MLLGKEHGIDRIPDAYNNGQPFWQDFFEARENIGDLTNPARSLAWAARNPIRHTYDPIQRIMEHFADPYTSRPRNIPSETDMMGFAIDQQRVDTMLSNVLRHASRASQRADGSNVVNDRERYIRSEISIVGTSRGTEAIWPTKYKRPAPHLSPGEDPPSDGIVMVTARNKCPIGYTPDAFSPMPITKIMDAILVYLRDNTLNDPRIFMAPKHICSVVG